MSNSIVIGYGVYVEAATTKERKTKRRYDCDSGEPYEYSWWETTETYPSWVDELYKECKALNRPAIVTGCPRIGDYDDNIPSTKSKKLIWVVHASSCRFVGILLYRFTEGDLDDALTLAMVSIPQDALDELNSFLVANGVDVAGCGYKMFNPNF